MKNITLIGMPTSGKSTVGVVLAKVLGYSFLDSDLLIQEKEGMLLKDIIELKGDDGFIEVEENVNASIDVNKTVISTGGSVIYGKRAMEHLRKISTVIYIKLPFEEINNRLENAKMRGVVLKEGQTLKDLYDERTPLYEKYAHIIIDADGLGVEELMNKIVDEFCKF